MELEKIETKENILSGVQTENLFISIARGKDATEIITTSRGDFKIKFAKAKDLEEIARRIAFKMAGIPSSCFSANSMSLINEIATLDVLVVKGPAWYENLKEENVSFSWADIPSIVFIQEVYAKAYEFRVKVQKLLEHDEKTTNSQMDDSKIVANSDNTDNTFTGLSGSD